MDILEKADKQEEKGKTTENVHGCNERGHTEGWCDRRGCKEERMR